MTSERYQAAVGQARDLLRWRSPLRAELWASRLAAELAEEREAGALDTALAADPSREAALIAAALSSVGVPAAGARPADPWTKRLGQVECVGARYGRADRYGEQTLAALSFVYASGKEPHVLVVGIDQVHGGLAVDAVVEEPKFLDDLTLPESDPAVTAARVVTAFRLTGALLDARVADTFAPLRAFALARAAPLAAETVPEAAVAVELPDLPGADEAFEALREFVGDRPLWWSPSRVSAFLQVWLPREAVLSDAAIQAVPEVTRAWTRATADEPEILARIDADVPGLPARMADDSLASLRKRLARG
jgi:hypothetical protein